MQVSMEARRVLDPLELELQVVVNFEFSWGPLEEQCIMFPTSEPYF